MGRLSIRQRSIFFGLLALYLFLLGWNTITRLHQLSTDAFNYIDVARHVRQGDGLVQSALGFNVSSFPLTAHPPAPLVAQGPLFPIAIAGVSALGIEPTVAAYLFATLAFAAFLLLLYLLLARVFSETTAVASLALLLLFPPLYAVLFLAESDIFGIAAMMAVLLMAAVTFLDAGKHRWLPLILGLCAGLALDVRYALAPIVLVAIIFLWGNKTISRFVYFILGFLVGFAPVVARIWHLTGTLLGPPRLPSDISFSQDILQGVFGALGIYLRFPFALPSHLVFFILAAASVLILLVSLQKKFFWSTIRTVALRRPTNIIFLWLVVYGVVIILLRSRIHLDALDYRLMLPAGVMLAPVCAILFTTIFRLSLRTVLFIASLVLLALILQQGNILRTPKRSYAMDAPTPERLAWVEKNTTNADLIIAEDPVDIEYYVRRPSLISYSQYPYNIRLTYEDLITLVKANCSRYAHAILLIGDGAWALQANSENREHFRYLYGDFLTNLAYHELKGYPRVNATIEQPEKGAAYEVSCQ